MSHDASGLCIDHDVPGAPLRLGQRVRVAPCGRALAPPRPGFLGREGVVCGFVYDDPARQYPADPLVRVRVRGSGEDLFFVEELAVRDTGRTARPHRPTPAERGARR